MRCSILTIIAILLFVRPGYVQEWEGRAQDFKAMPDVFRPNPLWFWNNAEVKPSELRRQMQEFKKAGYGGLSILPFGKDFKPEYLTDAYFQAYQVCMEEADRLGMKLCIYDEYGFPSGTAGDMHGDGIGRFKQKYPQLTYKRLDKVTYIPRSGETFSVPLREQYLMAVVAMDTISLTRVDLIDYVEEGSVLTWNVPAGAWKVMVFNCVDAGNSILDYLDPTAADRYIEMTHDAYFDRFSDYFGTVVAGTFFDEPTMYYADGRTWTPDFNRKFEQRYGFSPALYYPALWQDIGKETVEARNYLFGFRAQLFAEGYIKRVNDWSSEHGIIATGHLDNEEVLNSVGISGDFMKSFKFLDAPGIDKIGGDRPAERFYKLVSSAAYNWDHSLVMSETYGAMGNIGWDKIFGVAMEQYAKGINMLIPHAVWYDTENVTYPPELSLRNPIYADSLRAFTDYLTRLNVLMRNDARWVGEIAILYPIHTMQGDHYLDGPLGYYKGGVEIPYLDYTTVSVNLFDSLGYDHMYLHPEVLNEQCVVEKGKLHLKNKIQHNVFSVIIVPASKTIELQNLRKLVAFATTGGIVIFTSQKPTQATMANENDQVVSLMAELMEMDDVHFVEDPTTRNLRGLMGSYSNRYQLNFLNDPVLNIHKVLDHKNSWFLANPEDVTKHPILELNGDFTLEVWDPHTGAVDEKSIVIKKRDGKTYANIELAAFHSLFLIEK